MARIPSRTVNLKDGRKVLLRCAEESDALALVEAAKNTFLDGEGMVVEPDEFTKTEAEESAWIRGLNENPKELLLIAEADGRIVGNIDFHIEKRRRLAHAGVFGMSVQPGWRNSGMGSALLESLLQWARSVPEVEKVYLIVRADNPRAIALYRKHGFVQSGLAKDSIKLPDGTYVDELTMEMFVRS
jgi:RimJ/RimL family protein N-acetyltransferase